MRSATSALVVAVSIGQSEHMNNVDTLRALHVPGDPLILVNVWDAVSARTVASAPGVRAIASASHAVSYAHGVPDGEGLTLHEALTAARRIVGAVDLPVSIDFERGYATSTPELTANIARLIETGAAGLNIEDTAASGALFSRSDAAARIAAVAAAGELAINARSDALVRGGTLVEAIDRGNAYLDAGATSVFVLGLSSEQQVADAVAGIRGPVAVIAGAHSIALPRLAELGVARVSFGPGSLGLVLSHLRDAATGLTARGPYPPELDFA
jgi:2-methylisocitrate lyase-like PEP mutase family enzyme